MSYEDDEGFYYDGPQYEDREPIILKYRQVKFETQKAYLIEFEMCEDLSTVEAWIPKNQCSLLRGNKIEVEAWLVEEKELEEYAE